MEIPFIVKEMQLDDPVLAAEVLRIQLLAHQVEVECLSYPQLPLMWRDVAQVMACTERVIGAFEGEALRGVLVASQREQGSWHVERTVVDPQYFGMGWGYRLLNHLLADARDVSVDTAEVNAAAVALYHKAGFVLQQRWSVPDGLVLWRMQYSAGRLQPVLSLDAGGWIREACQIPSPNCDARDSGLPELLVIHNISLPPYRYGGQAVAQLFTNTLDPADDPFYASIHQLRVSAHFFIRRNGQLVQFVPVLQRAWHAGVSSWQGRERCNDFSIGVELEGCDFEAFTDAQYQMLLALIRELQAHLPLRGMTGHEHIAPGRKTDPGPYFDWARLRAEIDLPA
ncbi:MAG: 1,6-anhydro-N-acetylmuramyl-L-alanine amidase AmpD [Aquitalea sp.]|nr:1,6-anhydro-N-acetylmuramyl-L-alanine amidase AmpD [Aquitalea sp.]